MSFLTKVLVGGVPSLALRAGAIALALGTLVGYGYTKGLHHQEAKDAAVFEKIRAAQDEQAIHAGRIALDRSVAIQSTVDTYESQRRSVADYYAGKLRDARAGSGPGSVSTAALPAGVAERPADARSSPEYVELEGRCAETTLMYLKLREAAVAVQSIN